MSLSSFFQQNQRKETWFLVRETYAFQPAPRPETHHVRWIEADPHVRERLFVAVEAGASSAAPTPAPVGRTGRRMVPRDTHQLSTHLAAPERLYSAAGDGYFESRDGGDTWQRFEEGLRHRYLWSIASE